MKGENNDLASNDAFSGEAVAQGNSKQNKGTAAAKKTIMKKAATVAPVKVEAAEINKAAKKASPKKVAEPKVEAVAPQPAKPKKAAAKKTESIVKEDSNQKTKIKRQTATKKQPLAEQPQIFDDVSTTPAPAAIEGGNVAVATGQQQSNDAPAASSAEPYMTEDVTVAIAPVPDMLEATIAESAQQPVETAQPEAATTPTVEEVALPEEQPGSVEPETVPSPQAAPAVASTLRQITFQVRYNTKFGESLYVTGDHELLGNKDPEKAFPLRYLNNDYWIGTLEIPADQNLSEDISYNYVHKNVDGAISVDWGNDKFIEPIRYQATEVLLIDSWNSSAFIENTFYTEPFQEVLLKENFTEVQPETPGKVTHIFRVKAPLLSKGQTICITGDVPELGEWDIENPLLLSRKAAEPWFTISLNLASSTFPFAYKYGVFDVNTNAFVQYEDGKNRVFDDIPSPDKLTVVSDGFAVLPNTGFKGAGVAIPVFSLRSEKSFGVGEFADLKLLVDWAKQVGLKLIQLLPVNDTTATHSYTDSYPYAAISAFALHPLYLHLPAIVNKENQALLNSLQEKQAELNSQPAVDYVGVMAAKWDLIKQIFPSQKEQTFHSSDFKSFFAENAHWLVPYAAFSYFREKYNTSDFNKWPANNTFNAEQIKEIASSPLTDRDEVSMYYYVQYHLHLQLKDAATYAHQNGIIVKGDIPIGIYRDSCDAWQEPELFNMNMQAGAPPDDFAVKGQNWGFPTYNWQKMRENGFTWWKNRFKQMSYYFDAFRIDHILGFFRIWSIPMDSVEGIMGHFVPALPVHINEFTDRGISFDAARFTQPFINDAILSEIFGTDSPDVISRFLEKSSGTNYTLKPEFDTQRKVENYFASLEPGDQDKKIKTGLFDLVSNVILFEAEGSDGQGFHFRIAMDTTQSFTHLEGHVQYLLKQLYIDYFFRRQDEFWRKEAMLKLPELKRSTNMLICGEDLGMVPASVPGVMNELAILSLEIQRMPKDLLRQFFHPNDAPYLSVVTPSTHDMSTIRGWWEEDRAVTQRFFNDELGQWGTAPYFCEPWINRIIVMQHLYSPAMWSIFQLQDILGIDGRLRRENPHEERINVPAEPKHYWRYRMHLPLESLLKETDFISELRGYISQSGR